MSDPVAPVAGVSPVVVTVEDVTAKLKADAGKAFHNFIAHVGVRAGYAIVGAVGGFALAHFHIL